MSRRLVAIDFETHGIDPRPAYPPKPVGVAIREKGRGRGKYLAWGHPGGNNCSIEGARARLQGLWRDPDVEMIFHNATFDLDVAETHLNLPLPPVDRWHDTLFLAFLYDPHAPSLSLKPLAERMLGMAPEERDLVREWILANVPAAKRAPTTWGAYIWQAPVPLVGPYAIGDVARTLKLFEVAHTYVKRYGMNEAYLREKKLMPILLRMERAGLPIATIRLAKAIPEAERDQAERERWLLRRLKVPRVRWDSFTFAGNELADALESAGKIREWVLTDKGNRSVAAEALAQCCTDKELLNVLEVHSQTQTCLTTFMRPWLAQAREHDGRFYTSYNQVRGERGGARTGRMSQTPNLQNVLNSENKDSRVPRLRDFIVPSREPGGKRVLFGRDYSQQELRIFAHFEAGAFLESYRANPSMDGHVLVGNLINEIVGIDLPRKPVKNLNFGAIYGLGVGGLAVKLGVSIDEARRLKRAHQQAIPGVKAMYDLMRQLAHADAPIRTWGGRLYFCEPPKLVKGRVREFDYKLVNYLVQGSAADCTKQAMINYADRVGDDWWQMPLLLQVHDELNGETPHHLLADAQLQLRLAMADVDFKVPMLSDGKWSPISWERMKPYNDGVDDA